MEEVLLSILGGQSHHRQTVRPPMSLESIDNRALLLQTNSIEISTVKGYATGAWDYISFCLKFSLPLTPTPQTLACYIAYTSKYIASAPKYLTGAQHFLNDIYPEFDTNRAHPLVQSTIRGSKKIRVDPIRRKQPLRLSHLEAFIHVANTTCAYDDLLFATLLSCCFYGCHHLGELVWNNGTGVKLLSVRHYHFHIITCNITFPITRETRFIMVQMYCSLITIPPTPLLSCMSI